MSVHPGRTMATDVPLRNTGQQSRALFLGNLGERHPACRPVYTLSQDLQRGVEGLGPMSEAPDFSCLPRGLQESWMNKCITKEFLCSTHHCTNGRGSPEREVDLLKAWQPYHSWGRPGSMAPVPPPVQSSGHHTSGEVGCWAHTGEVLLAVGLRLSPACCLHTPMVAAGLTGVGPSAANTKHTTT